MADDEKIQQDDEKTKDTGESKQQDNGKIGILTWAILAVIVVLCAGSGFLLGRLFAGSSAPETTEPSQTAPSISSENPETDASTTEAKNRWYYPLEPVVANLNEPAVTRYIRASITLEISSMLDKKNGEKLLEEKKPVLINWLTIYLAGLTLEDIRGDKNLKRIQLQILDAFNEELFPDAKPLIKHILFKEFAIQ